MFIIRTFVVITSLLFCNALLKINTVCSYGNITGICLKSYHCFSKLQVLGLCSDGFVCCGDTGISEAKCAHYKMLEARGEWDKDPENITEAATRIVGGKPAEVHEFPFLVSIGYKVRRRLFHKWICGGTLISTKFVLTARHCLTVGLRPGDEGPAVRLGGIFTFGSKDDKIASVKENYGVRMTSEDLFQADIALMELERDVVFSRDVKPACLNIHSTLRSSMALAAGWGIVDNKRTSVNYLKKTELKMYDKESCYSHVPAFVRAFRLKSIDESVVCAGDLNGKTDTCQGDSGGPLFQRMEDSRLYSLIGITSSGGMCAAVNRLAIYVSVNYFKSWIEAVVWPDEVN